MLLQSTITQKGQVTIPKRIRDILLVKPYEKVQFKVDPVTHVVVLEPVQNILTLKNFLRKKSKVNTLDTKKNIEDNYKRL